MLKKIIFNLFFGIFCVFILGLTIRGFPGNPTAKELNDNKWKDNGPLELSPDRGRFALTYSIIEDHSFYFSQDIARFATPDLGFFNGKYVSLFAPGVSYLIMPGYIIGRAFGASQVGTFAVISLFALLNVFLIKKIGKLLGASEIAAAISGIIFIFATPAFAYGVALYQHHISTFLILSALYLALRYSNFTSLFAIWMLCAASIPIDYPNLFLMFPIGVYSLGKIFLLKADSEKIKIDIKLAYLLSFIGAILPLSFFLRFNKLSYGNPLQLSGTIPRIQDFDEQNNPVIVKSRSANITEKEIIDPAKQKKSALKFFNSRYLLEGFYIHFLSPDRGILIFTPVIIISIFGFFNLYKKNAKASSLVLAVIGTNILLYSMWGDPYGGWAFASRYLIPAYALMSIYLSFALSKYSKNLLFCLFFIIVAGFSIAVNTLGAITTNRNPPKIEADALSKISGRIEKYSFDRNYEFLIKEKSKSFIYQSLASKYLTAYEYYVLIAGAIFAVNVSFVSYLFFKKNK